MNNIVFYFIGVSISLTVLYLLYLLLHRNDTFFGLKRSFLLGIIIFSLIIPLINFSITETSTVEYSYMLDSITVYADSINYTIDSRPQIFDHIGVFYLVGFLLFALKFLVMLLSLVQKVRRSEKRFMKGKTVYLTEESGSHYSFLGMIFIGSVNNETEIDRIIEHEYVHLKKGHTFDILFLELIGIIFWFNPVMFLIKRSIRIVHEYQADNDLIARGVSRLEYQKLLLSAAMGVKTNFLTNSFNKSFLKKRFLMMSKIKSPAWLRIKTIFFLPFLASLIFLFACVKEQIDDFNYDLAGIELKSENQSNSNIRDVEQKNFKYFSVKVAPQFPGGENELIKYISSNVNYPEKAKANGIQGKVYVQFVVSKSGKVRNISIKKGVDKLLDDEAIRVMTTMNDWSPGINEDGNPVNVEMIIPINFRLN